MNSQQFSVQEQRITIFLKSRKVPSSEKAITLVSSRTACSVLTTGQTDQTRHSQLDEPLTSLGEHFRLHLVAHINKQH